MVLPTSGNPISLNQVNVELSQTATAQIALNDAAVRGLVGKSSGSQFSMSELHGVSSTIGWIYTIWRPTLDGTTAFTDITFDSSGNLYAIVYYITRAANRATNSTGYTGNYELLKFNSDGVLQSTKGFSLDHVSSANHNDHTIKSTVPIDVGTNLLTTGTDDLYVVSLRNMTQFSDIGYTYVPRTMHHIIKHNQSDLDAEDKRWAKMHLFGRPQNDWGGNPGAFKSNWIQTGREHFHGILGDTWIDANGKLNVSYPFQESNSSSGIQTVRYKSNSQYNDGVEAAWMTKFNGHDTNYFNLSGYSSNYQSHTYSHAAHPVVNDIAKNWRCWIRSYNAGGDNSYFLWKEPANQTAINANVQTYTGNEPLSWLYQLNQYQDVKYMCLDNNGNPAVFGRGGVIGYAGSTMSHGQQGVWCQKHTSTGDLDTVRFSFTANSASSSGTNGEFIKAIFDSSGNCYMLGHQQITVDKSGTGLWGSRGANSWNYPHSSYIVKFNSSGVHLWHKYFENRQIYNHFTNGNTGFGFQSTYGTHWNHTPSVVPMDIAIDSNGDPVISGKTRQPFPDANPGNWITNSHHSVPFIIKLPADGNIPDGYVGKTGAENIYHTQANSLTSDTGFMIGSYNGNGYDTNSQWNWQNHTHTPVYGSYSGTARQTIWPNSNYKYNNLNVFGYFYGMYGAWNGNTPGNLQAGATNLTLPQTISRQGTGYGHHGIMRSQSDNNANHLPYTPPSNPTGSGLEEF